MKKESLGIAALPILLLLFSMVYYLCLLLVMPAWLLFATCTAAGVCLAIFLYRFIRVQNIRNERSRLNLFFVYGAVLLIAFAVAESVLSQVSVFGHWDAWWFWNYRAKFLSDPELWKATVGTKENGAELVDGLMAHPDYPPGVSSAVAFFWRLFPGYSMSVAFMIALCFGLAIPLLLFTECYKRNLLIAAAAVLYFFAFNPFYAWHVSYMIGDIWISFFLLGTLASWDYFKKDGGKKALIITGLMLGGLLWSKNEGLVLVLLFLLFQRKGLFSAARLRALLAGLGVPFALFLVFKIGYAPKGDLFGTGTAALEAKLFSAERYILIGHLFANEVKMHFTGVQWLCALYVVYLFSVKRFPAKHLMFLIAVMAAYTLVYVLSPHDLEWHVLTSMDRLMWHIVPALVYVLLSEFPLEKLQEQQQRLLQGIQAKFKQ